MRRTLLELADRTAATVVGDGNTVVTGVATDSRAVRRSDLFIALPGERVDGHGFVPDAGGNGAAAALVAHRVDAPLPQLVVPDTLAALHRIATVERALRAFRLIGITGSIGKTTTKDYLAALLSTTYVVGATRGSRNSQAGFPAELCSQAEGIDWMVAELGMTRAGELDRLGAVARPDVLVYTVIAPVHIEFFADVDAIAEAKAEVLPYLDPAGTLVLNNADPRVAALASRFAGTVLTYGVPQHSDLWIEGFSSYGLRGAAFTLRANNTTIPIEWKLAGRHQADNLLAAACSALTLGVPAERIGAAASALGAPRRRGEVHNLASGVMLVDDSYNASPKAVMRLLDLLAETEGRKVAVLGEMLELGSGSVAYHREVGERAGAVCDLVVTVGGDAAAALSGAARTVTHHVPEVTAAMSLVPGLLRAGDVVLVKGSRSIALDRLVDALVAGRA